MSLLLMSIYCLYLQLNFKFNLVLVNMIVSNNFMHILLRILMSPSNLSKYSHNSDVSVFSD